MCTWPFNDAGRKRTVDRGSRAMRTWPKQMTAEERGGGTVTPASK